MEKIIWSIDSNMTPDDHSINKVIRIAKCIGKHIDVLIDKRNRASERLYWKLLTRTREFNDELTTHQEKLITEIKQQLDNSQITYKIHESIDDDYMYSLGRLVIKDSLLIAHTQAGILRHPFFSLAKDFDCNIFLIDKKPWPVTVNIAATVDPLHENDRPAKLDQYIVQFSKTLKNKISGRWRLVHCCFISPFLLKHQSKINEIHREALTDFAKETGTLKTDITMLQGKPETALPKWINENKIDILCLGYIARNDLHNYLVGSTTHALLKKVPCDMLMVHQS